MFDLKLGVYVSKVLNALILIVFFDQILRFF